MQTLADMRGVGVKNMEKYADVLCGRPLLKIHGAPIRIEQKSVDCVYIFMPIFCLHWLANSGTCDFDIHATFLLII